MNEASEDWLMWLPQAGSHQAPSTLFFTDNKAGFGLSEKIGLTSLWHSSRHSPVSAQVNYREMCD